MLHTLNLRLFPEQLAYVIDHGQDKVVIVDATVLPLLTEVAEQIPTVEHHVLVGEGDTSGLGDEPVHRYEDLLEAAPATYHWRTWTSARRWRCAARAARPATRRASSTATARPGCTEPLARMISQLRPTLSGAVPTIWNDLLPYVDQHETVSARCAW